MSFFATYYYKATTIIIMQINEIGMLLLLNLGRNNSAC